MKFIILSVILSTLLVFTGLTVLPFNMIVGAVMVVFGVIWIGINIVWMRN